MLNISLRYNESIDEKLPKQKAFKDSQRSDCQIAAFRVSSDFMGELEKRVKQFTFKGNWNNIYKYKKTEKYLQMK